METPKTNQWNKQETQTFSERSLVNKSGYKKTEYPFWGIAKYFSVITCKV